MVGGVLAGRAAQLRVPVAPAVWPGRLRCLTLSFTGTVQLFLFSFFWKMKLNHPPEQLKQVQVLSLGEQVAPRTGRFCVPFGFRLHFRFPNFPPGLPHPII